MKVGEMNSDMQQDHIIQGSFVLGIVEDITPYNIYIRFGDDVVGSCPVEEVRWENEPEAEFPVPSPGDKVECLVMQTGGSPRVSLRRCRFDPWDNVKEDFPVGKLVSFRVKRVAKFAYGDIVPGIEAKVDKSELREYFEQFPDLQLGISRDIYVGDQFEALVAGYDEHNRCVEVSIRERLEIFQIGEISASLSGPAEAYRITLPTGHTSRNDASSTEVNTQDLHLPNIKTIAIINMDLDFCNTLSGYLEQLDYEVVVASSSDELMDTLENRGVPKVDIFFIGTLDHGEQNNERVLEFIGELKELGFEQRIVLIASSYEFLPTGEFPVLWQPIGNMHEIDAVIGQAAAGLQVALPSNQTPQAREDASYERLEQLLNRACVQFQATWGAVFSLHPVSEKCDLFAYYEHPSHHGLLERFEQHRNYLARSPVRDCAVGREEIFEQDARNRPGKHRNLLRLCGYHGCIGLPLDSPGGKRYCMFLLFNSQLPDDTVPQDNHSFCFFDRVQAADEVIQADTLMKLRAHLWAAKMSAILTEANVMNSITKMHEMSNRGLVFEGIGHEVHVDISDITAALRRITGNLARNEPDLALREAEDVRRKNQEVADKIKLLAGRPVSSRRISRLLEDEIGDVAESLSKYAQLKQVELDLQTKGDTRLQAYPSGIDQIVTNLVLNAIDQVSQFVRRRGKVILRFGEVDHKDRPIRILVLDNGPGIHRSEWRAIFEAGYTTKPDGSGLGLTIARRLAESMGGKVNVRQSIVFIGTGFEVELPRTAHYGII